MQQGKLILVDAYAFIYRAYYAYMKSPRINSKGMNTSAIFGFVNTLDSVLKAELPTHIGVAFDTPQPTFRHEAYPQYKAQREKTPEDIHAAVPYIKRILTAYQIPILEMPGFEADDVIGTLALQAGQAGFRTLMMTPDKDYGQLVGENVFIYKPRFGEKGFDLVGTEQIKAKYGIDNPCQIIDLLGLWGDTSDNIPGCPNVGEKRAKELLRQFGSIDELLARTDELKGALQATVRDNAEQIRFSRFLATIKIDVPIAFRPEELLRGEPDRAALHDIYEELEFRSLIERMRLSPSGAPAAEASAAPPAPVAQGGQLDLFAEPVVHEAAPAERRASSLQSLNTVEHSYHLVEGDAAVRALASKLQGVPALVLDTETTGLDPLTAELVGISFAVRPHEAYYIPFDFRDDLFHSAREQSLALLSLLRPLFEDAQTTKIGQNIKYDLLVLENYGIHLCGTLWDTMIAHYVLQPELRHGMDYLAEIYLHYRTIHIDELIGAKGKAQRNMRDLPPAEVYQYACEDADITLQLYDKLHEELERSGVQELFEQVEMPLVPVLARMERNGVRLHTRSLQETALAYNKRMQTIECNIYEVAGASFNIASPRQVGELLFNRLQLATKAKKTKKSGQFTTSEEELEKYRTAHPVVEQILAWRGLKKLLSTYIETLPRLINPQTGHVHTSFNQTVTSTGRLSSSNPNLQNIPVRDADGREVRKAFLADDETSLLLSADYSQIELRIMAHLSGDEHMIEAFRSGEDIHAATASKVFDMPLDAVTKEMRRQAKTANFGIIYGISTFGLAERMSVSRAEAKELIESYFATYPQVKEYMNRSIALAQQQGYVETLLHRRRYLPDISSPNAVVRGYAERNAINAPIQGSAADIIKLAMIRIHERMEREALQARMLLQVHDELVFSVPQGEQDRMECLVLEEMNNAYPLRVPLVADCGWGRNWLEAH
jgi:DNA polymerase-1